MTQEELRELVIQNIQNWLMGNPFTCEFLVKKNPTGIKIIYEVTPEQFKEIVNEAKQNWGKK